MRHAETTDGSSITANGRTQVQAAWRNEPCPTSNKVEIFYMSATNAAYAPSNPRYTQTADAVEAALRGHCAGIDVDQIKLDVTRLTSPRPAEIANIWTQMNTRGSYEEPSTRIFILGAALLRTMTTRTCSSGGQSCYIAAWQPFMQTYNAAKALFNCTHLITETRQLDRTFLYNYLFHAKLERQTGVVAKNTCASSSVISLNAEDQVCAGHTSAMTALATAQTCH